MELKSYEFLRTVIYQGKFGATPGDTLQQIGVENYNYSGRRGIVEVILRDTTIASYLANGFIKETFEDEKQGLPEPEPVVAAVKAERPNLKPAVPQSRAVDAKAKLAAQRPTGVTPSPTPKPVVAAPKPTPIIVAVAEPRKPEPVKKVATAKAVLAPEPEKTSPILEAVLSPELGEAEAIDAVLSRQKKVVRKGR